MLMVNIFEAKARLSDLIEQVTAGERIVICKRNQPVAELRPVAAARREPRPVGLAKGMVEIPPAFFDPLPDDLLEGFTSGHVYPPPDAPAAMVAERPVTEWKRTAPRKARRRSRRT